MEPRCLVPVSGGRSNVRLLGEIVAVRRAGWMRRAVMFTSMRPCCGTSKSGHDLGRYRQKTWGKQWVSGPAGCATRRTMGTHLAKEKGPESPAHSRSVSDQRPSASPTRLRPGAWSSLGCLIQARNWPPRIEVFAEIPVPVKF
jgi:hypothetical protein